MNNPYLKLVGSEIMKMFLLSIILVMSLLLPFNILYSSIFAEPEPYEDFIKKYQPLLDQAEDQKLPPKKQFEIGIKMPDTICFDDKVRILKLSDPTLVACVKSQTAHKLAESGWGLLEPETKSGETWHGVECRNAWTIEFEDSIPPKSTVVKALKISLLEISEQILWYPMEVFYRDSSVIISTQGAFYEDEINSVKKSLETYLEKVSNVSYQQGPCI